jgi:hypothetical protein
MPPNPQTGIMVRNSTDEIAPDPIAKKILMYPENSLLNSHASIIAPSGMFSPGATYKVALDNGRKFQIRAIKAKESNPMIEQFSFEYLND